MSLIDIFVVILVLYLVSQNRKISGRVNGLEKQIADLTARIAEGGFDPAPASRAALQAIRDTSETLSARIGADEAEGGVTQAIETAPADRQEGGDTESVEPLPAIGPAPGPALGPAPVSPTKPRPSRENLESYLGARWPVWVGGVALAFGGIFLVRYSIEAGLLGPAARLTLASLFGLLLVAAGEIVRRKALPKIADLYANAMIPGALTAAGAVTLLGTVFAAYAFYGFLGAGTAFVLMALVSLATVALSLLHGQALAGLGLLGSLVTPLAVTSDEPNVNALFLFLGITWVAVHAASRIRRWTVVPMLANIGTGLWVLTYAAIGTDFDPLAPSLAMLVMIAGTIFLWPGRVYSPNRKDGWKALISRPPLKITLSLSIMVVLGALATVASGPGSGTGTGTGVDPQFAFLAVTAALAAFGASRPHAVWAALAAAAGAVLGTLVTALSLLDYIAPEGPDGTPVPLPSSGNEIAVTLGLGAIFTLLGLFFLRRFRREETEFSILWAFLMGAMPVGLGFISFLNFGNFFRDWTHGLYGLCIGIVMLAVAEWLFRDREDKDGFDWPANIVVAGSFAGLMLALHALSNGIVTTILVSVIGFAYLMAVRMRTWPALPWMMAAAIIIVFGRIAWEPTLIGANSLGTTPFFNALLAGYGIPTLFAILSAWLLRNSSDFRVRNIMQALASLSALITIAVLVHHAMNGGRLSGDIPTLGEQSIYTLITIGFSGILMTLDLKSPSPVFRFGSMIAGVVATANVLSLHVFALNPFFSGENTGPWPFINLLLLGYLLPALAYALTAHLARGRRPVPYVAMLAVSGAVLGFLWATLSVRRFWQGENIADWKGFLASETYTYSVVWLVIGVGLLALGSRLDAKSLRLASAGLVLIAVLKVFLVDMSNLEGILRALSFIGLGAVLIGIGLFYQKILVKKGGDRDINDSPDTAA